MALDANSQAECREAAQSSIPMKFLKNSTPARGCVLTVVSAIVGTGALAQSLPGIPEPGLTLYGEIRNTTGGGDVRLILGTLQWTVVPDAGAPITVTTELKNINDQFSYVVQVPFQTVLPGFALSPTALQLNSSPTDYVRTAEVDGVSATIVAPATDTFSFSSADRGRLERVDLTVAVAVTDRDGDGIPDAWETQFGLDPDDRNDGDLDLDGDGLTNAGEYAAGTQPDDAGSSFRFIEVSADPAVGVAVRWASVAGKTYTIERSTQLLDDFLPIAAGVSAPPPQKKTHSTTPRPSEPVRSSTRLKWNRLTEAKEGNRVHGLCFSGGAVPLMSANQRR